MQNVSSTKVIKALTDEQSLSVLPLSGKQDWRNDQLNIQSMNNQYKVTHKHHRAAATGAQLSWSVINAFFVWQNLGIKSIFEHAFC